jgi:hypothetical protein
MAKRRALPVSIKKWHNLEERLDCAVFLCHFCAVPFHVFCKMPLTIHHLWCIVIYGYRMESNLYIWGKTVRNP